jgi:hypothetical protein
MLQILVCHGSEDKLKASTLSYLLTDLGYQVSFDVAELLPNEMWGREIRRNMSQADAVIVCLSKSLSMTSQNVQVALETVIDAAQSRAASGVRLIVVAFEVCAVPSSLKRFPFVNLQGKFGLDNLVSHLARESTIRLSNKFKSRLGRLRLSPVLRRAVYEVCTHQEFPRMMSLSGQIVNNPVWDYEDLATLNEVREVYAVGGDNPPRIMHVDLLMIKRIDGNRGELYTYHSSDWGTDLITWAPRLDKDSPDERCTLDAQRLAPYLDVDSQSITVHPLPGEFIISLKPHMRYKDLFLYIFELCAVSIENPPSWLSDPGDTVTPPGKSWKGTWRRLDVLRNDEQASKVNGDVIRGLYERFWVDLEYLPASF